MAKYTPEQFRQAAQKAVEEHEIDCKIVKYTIDDDSLVVEVRSNSGKSTHGLAYYLQDDGTINRGLGGFQGENAIYRIGYSLIDNLHEFD